MKETYKRAEVMAAVVRLRERLKGRRDMNQRNALEHAKPGDRQALVHDALIRCGAYQTALDDVFAVFQVGGLLEPIPAVAKATMRRRPRKK